MQSELCLVGKQGTIRVGKDLEQFSVYVTVAFN